MLGPVCSRLLKVYLACLFSPSPSVEPRSLPLGHRVKLLSDVPKVAMTLIALKSAFPCADVSRWAGGRCQTALPG